MSSRSAHLYHLLRYARPLVLNSARTVQSYVGRYGLTVGSRAVLELLVEHADGITVPAAAARLDLQRQNVQRLVDQLLDRGLATRVPNPSHKRSLLVQPTEKGREVFTQLRTAEFDLLATIAPEITESEIGTACRVLAALDRDIRTMAIQEDDHAG
jgi:DNA-binding MarR family transcriptional regulator